MDKMNIIKTMDSDEYFMRMVYLVASRSKDPKTKIGSVLTRNGEVISTAYNGFAKGVLDLEERYNDRELKRQLVCHSEFNAITLCACKGIATLDSVLYTQGISCHECCKSLIQGGVRKLVVHSQWPNLTHSPKWVESIAISTMMLGEAGVDIIRFDKGLGLKGWLDGKEITV